MGNLNGELAAVLPRQLTPPTFDDVRHAAKRIAGRAVRTQLLQSDVLDAQTNRKVFLKPEMLQVTGSFKFRGAYNRLSQLSERERGEGVIAWSSGNHAQGVAAASSLLGVRARIVMPADAPRVKVLNTQQLGGETILYDRQTQSREEIAYALQEKEGGVIVPSFDDPHIIAGQGTVGLELLEDVDEQGENLDALLVCCGGGGLTAGCGLAVSELSPSTEVFCVEPEGYDDHARSLRSGRRERADASRQSICDALLTPMPGLLTFELNRHHLAGGLVVSDDDVKAAMAFAYRTLKLVVEPGGAAALAALLSGRLDPSYRKVGVVLSGGNVDETFYNRVLAEYASDARDLFG